MSIAVTQTPNIFINSITFIKRLKFSISFLYPFYYFIFVSTVCVWPQQGRPPTNYMKTCLLPTSCLFIALLYLIRAHASARNHERDYYRLKLLFGNKGPHIYTIESFFKVLILGWAFNAMFLVSDQLNVPPFFLSNIQLGTSYFTNL